MLGDDPGFSTASARSGRRALGGPNTVRPMIQRRTVVLPAGGGRRAAVRPGARPARPERRQAVPGRGADAGRGDRADRRVLAPRADRDPEPGLLTCCTAAACGCQRCWRSGRLTWTWPGTASACWAPAADSRRAAGSTRQPMTPWPAGPTPAPRLGTYLARRAAHDTAARHRQPGRCLLQEAGRDRCQGMTGNPFGTDVCHLRPHRPGDIPRDK